MTTAQRSEPEAVPGLEAIMDLLAEVLCTERESLDSEVNFSDLGVDSVLSVEFAARLRAAFNVRLRAADLYEIGRAHV